MKIRISLQVHSNHSGRAIEVAGHMTHSFRTAATYYKEMQKPQSAAETGGFLQDILWNPFNVTELRDTYGEAGYKKGG